MTIASTPRSGPRSSRTFGPTPMERLKSPNALQPESQELHFPLVVQAGLAHDVKKTRRGSQGQPFFEFPSAEKTSTNAFPVSRTGYRSRPPIFSFPDGLPRTARATQPAAQFLSPTVARRRAFTPAVSNHADPCPALPETGLYPPRTSLCFPLAFPNPAPMTRVSGPFDF